MIVAPPRPRLSLLREAEAWARMHATPARRPYEPSATFNRRLHQHRSIAGRIVLTCSVKVRGLTPCWHWTGHAGLNPKTGRLTPGVYLRTPRTDVDQRLKARPSLDEPRPVLAQVVARWRMAPDVDTLDRNHVSFVCLNEMCVNPWHLVRAYRARVPREHVEQILRLHHEGRTWNHLIKHLGFSHYTVTSVRHAEWIVWQHNHGSDVMHVPTFRAELARAATAVV